MTRVREPVHETAIRHGRVVRAFLGQFGFAATLAFLVRLEHDGLRRARIPSARTLRHLLLARIPRRADLDVIAAQLGVSRDVVRYHWRKRHARRR
jgi:hypothetical protein